MHAKISYLGFVCEGDNMTINKLSQPEMTAAEQYSIISCTTWGLTNAHINLE